MTDTANAPRKPRLHADLRHLRKAMDLFPDAIVLIDHDGCLRWANAAATRLLGVDAARDHGRALTTLLKGSQLGEWLASGRHDPPPDIPAPTDDDCHLGITLIPFGDDQQALLARDISHIARLEKMRRDFVANVSHELRTPLTVIHGYLELFDPEDVPDLAPALLEMRAQSQRMGQIVEDLLTLSRLETQQNAEDEHVAMDAMLISLQHEAEALSRNRHVIRVTDVADIDLRGSHRDLHGAFSNLVSNAVRYTPEGGSIEISWRGTPAGGAVYAVTDTGTGIPEEHLGRLSERFYRVSSSRSRAKGGTGLGLSIVKHVLSLHQARLDIRSQLGAGSTFSCHFDASRVLPRDADDD